MFYHKTSTTFNPIFMLLLFSIGSCISEDKVNQLKLNIDSLNIIQQSRTSDESDRDDLFPGTTHFMPSDTGKVEFLKYVSENNRIRFSAPSTWRLKSSNQEGFSFSINDEGDEKRFEMILNKRYTSKLITKVYLQELINNYIISDSSNTETQYFDITRSDKVPIYYLIAENKRVEKAYKVLLTESDSAIINFTYAHDLPVSSSEHQLMTLVFNSIRIDGYRLISED